MDKGKKSEKDLIRKYGDLDPYEVLYDELLSILQDDFQVFFLVWVNYFSWFEQKTKTDMDVSRINQTRSCQQIFR